MKNIPVKVDGVDSLSVDEFNPNQEELENAVTTSDQTLNEANENQLPEAMARYGSGGADFYQDSGAVNAYILTGVGSFIKPAVYFDGLSVKFYTANTNTGPATINVAGIGVKDLVLTDGSALTGGEVIAGSLIIATYDLASDKVRLNPISDTPPVPTGVSMSFRGSVAPSGYVLEDGATYDSVSDTSFAALFAVIGTIYGGTGASDFNVPDSRGRLDIGLDNLGGTPADRMTNAQADVLGGTGGSEEHTLILSETPVHDHTIAETTQAGTDHLKASAGVGGQTGSQTTSSAGSGNAHANDQPWMAATKIIKK